MILVKDSNIEKKYRDRRTVNITIEELPKRPTYVFRTEKDMVKFVKKIEMIVRHSQEYKDYISWLKKNMDFNKCAILRGLKNGEGKKYTIEIHHEPFNLFQIVQTVLAKYQILEKDLNPYELANEVMELHYAGKVGLIPLSATQHKLVHDGRIFIPLQQIYQDYTGFVEEYEDYIPDKVQELIQYKVDMSMKCGQFQSNVLTPEFVYLNVDGFEFPSVPEEWGVRKKVLEEAIENPKELPEGSPTSFKIGDDISI